MPTERFVEWNPDWTVKQAALEGARVAYEGLGSTQLEPLQATFNQKIQEGSADQEVQLRAVVRMLVKLTDVRTGPKDAADTRIAGLCLMWLSHTRVDGWTLLQLYNWGCSLPSS